jgi:tetratricopeptide (TPR) repeat protein
LDERDSFVRKAQGYWGKAKETYEDIAGPEMLFPAPCAHDLLWGAGDEEALTSVNKALENCRKAKDKFLIGAALDWLAYHTGWTVHSTDDPDEFAEMRSKVIQCAEEAKRQYSPISFMSPRADAHWIEAIHAEGDLFGIRFETDPQKKRGLYERGLDAVKDVQKRAESSGYQKVVHWVHVRLYWLLLSLAGIETNSERKKRLLKESLRHGEEALRLAEQMEPLGYWDRGIVHVWVASIKWDSALLAEDSEAKRKMLEEAVAERENGLKLMARDLEYQPQKRVPLLGLFGRHQYVQGDWLNRLYGLTHEKGHLEKAVTVFSEAVESYQKTRITSRAAECYWKAAQAYDGLGEHLKSAESFSLASSSFGSAVEKVPQLKKLYEQHAVYMQAWSEIEKARHHHERQEYGLAREHFEKAADLHKPLKQWGYLASNYFAWAQVEDGEELSRKEQSEEAIKAFEQAAALFGESSESLQTRLSNVEDADEKQMATSMVKASGLRHEYCEARKAIEEARILDKKGDHFAS